MCVLTFVPDFRMVTVCRITKRVFLSDTPTVCGLGSVVRIATDYGLDGPGVESWWGGRDFAHLSGPGAHPASCKMGTESFPGLKSGRGVTLTPHHLLVPWSRKSRAIPVLPLWALPPVQSLSACKRVNFTFSPLRVLYVKLP